MNEVPPVTPSTAIRSPVSAILWEIWTAHRLGFAAVIAALPICALSAHWSLDILEDQT